jgi:hypothetical protein
MTALLQVAATVAGALAVTALALPSAAPASAAPKNRPETSTTATWAAPWTTQPGAEPCTGLTACASASPAGDLRAATGPATAGVQGGNSWSSYAESAEVVFADALPGTVASRTYTATVVLHNATTSDAGTAVVMARLVEAPYSCYGNCVVGGGAYIASGDAQVNGDVVMTITFRLALDPYTSFTALPAGTYRLGFGVRAGIAEDYHWMAIPMPCMTDGCQLSTTAHWGVGSADISATVQKVTR